MVELTNDIIDYQALTEQIRSNQAGALVLFLGTVREMTDGRQTLALDYDAFPEMAVAKMEELEAEVRERWSVTSVGIVHRLGHLELGEISVAVAVSSPHRELAFEAGTGQAPVQTPVEESPQMPSPAPPNRQPESGFRATRSWA